jgi:hypothetical protein
MKLAFVLVTALLSGCAATKPPIIEVPIVVTKQTYMIIEPPKELLTAPDAIPTPDPATATEKEVAIWITQIHGRMSLIESKLNLIGEYIENRILLLENNGIKKEQIIR